MADLGELTRQYQNAIEHLRVMAQIASERPLDEEIEFHVAEAQQEAMRAKEAMVEEWAKREADRAAAQWEDGIV